MSVLYIALPLAILLGAVGLLACWFCIRTGQYDDLESPSVRILIDDQDQRRNAENEKASEPSGRSTEASD